jgi:hypothetical protein
MSSHTLIARAATARARCKIPPRLECLTCDYVPRYASTSLRHCMVSQRWARLLPTRTFGFLRWTAQTLRYFPDRTSARCSTTVHCIVYQLGLFFLEITRYSCRSGAGSDAEFRRRVSLPMFCCRLSVDVSSRRL